MLQPINTVLPTVVGDPYNINVALPQVDPIGVETKLEQIDSMRMNQQAQQAQIQQGYMNIETQRQRLAQDLEIHKLNVEKHKAAELDKLNTLRSDAFSTFDKITNLPVYSEADAKFLKGWREKYGLTDTSLEALATGDRVQIGNIESQLRKAMVDPEYQAYVRRSTKVKAFDDAVAATPDKFNLGEYNNFRTQIAEGGVTGANEADMSVSRFIVKKGAMDVLSEGMKSLTAAMGGFPSDPASFEEGRAYLVERGRVSGVDITPEQAGMYIEQNIVNDNELAEYAEAGASMNNVSFEQVFPILKFVAQSSGRAGVQKFVATMYDSGFKAAVEESKQSAILARELAKIGAQGNVGDGQVAAGINMNERATQLKNSGYDEAVKIDKRLISDYGVVLGDDEISDLDEFVSATKGMYTKDTGKLSDSDIAGIYLVRNAMQSADNPFAPARGPMTESFAAYEWASPMNQNSAFQKAESDARRIMSNVDTEMSLGVNPRIEFDWETGTGEVVYGRRNEDGEVDEERRVQMNAASVKAYIKPYVDQLKPQRIAQPEQAPQSSRSAPTTFSYEGTPLEAPFNAAKEVVGGDANAASYLVSLLGGESQYNSNAKNPNSTAAGLMQITDYTFMGLNSWLRGQGKPTISREELNAMPVDAQISLVYPYFKQSIKGGIDAAKIGLSLFAPSKARDVDYNSQNRGNIVYDDKQAAYRANSNLDRPGEDGKQKGHINVADVMTHTVKNLPGMVDAYRVLPKGTTFKSTAVSVMNEVFANEFAEILRGAGTNVVITEAFRDPSNPPKNYGAKNTAHFTGSAIDVRMNADSQRLKDWLTAQQKQGKYTNVDMQLHKKGENRGTADHWHIVYKPSAATSNAKSATAPSGSKWIQVAQDSLNPRRNDGRL